MSIPDYLVELIDRASKTAGSDNKLAQSLGVPRQHVSNWRHGQRACPIAEQVLMAEIAGLEPEGFAARAIVAGHSGEKRERLERALKKSLVAIGAAIALSGQAAAATVPALIGAGKTLQEVLIFVLYTMYRKSSYRGRERPNTVPLRYMGFHPIPHPTP